jgi:hypothetical protein
MLTYAHVLRSASAWKPGGKVQKKEIMNREGFLMQMYKTEKNICQVKNSKLLQMLFLAFGKYFST